MMTFPVRAVSTSPTAYKITGGHELRRWRMGKGVEVEGAEYSDAYKRGHWDGRIYPGYRMTMSPRGTPILYAKAGLLPALQAAFPDMVVENQHTPPSYPSLKGVLRGAPHRLRDYQVETLGAMMSHRWGRVALATNAGKGAIIGLFCAACEAVGLRSLVVCDSVAVLDALREEVCDWGGMEEVGLVEAGAEDPPQTLTTIGMVPTLHRRRDRPAWMLWLSEVDVLLLDEADQATASMWGKLLDACCNSYWRFGFSGTFPDSGTVAHLKLEEYVGPILTEVRNKDLVEREISAKPFVSFLPVKHDLGRDRPEGWAEMSAIQKRQWVFDEAVVHNPARHHLIRSRLDAEGKNVIIVRRIAHGEELEDCISGSVFISGSTPRKRREEVVEAWRGGEHPTLIVTNIMDRGTNRLGWAGKVIMASGEGSDRQTLQRIGRGLRRSGGKVYVEFEDIMDTGHRYLRKQARKRVRLYNDEGFDTFIAPTTTNADTET